MADSVPTPLIDKLWNPAVLKSAHVMIGRLLFGVGPNTNDHWELGMVAFGDSSAQNALLHVLRGMFALRKPEAPAKDLIAFDTSRFYGSHALRMCASLLVMRENLFSSEWMQLLARTDVMVFKSLVKPDIVTQWDLPVLGLADSSDFSFPLVYDVKNAGSILRRVVPFRITDPSDPAAPTWMDTVLDEIPRVLRQGRGCIHKRTGSVALRNLQHA